LSDCHFIISAVPVLPGQFWILPLPGVYTSNLRMRLHRRHGGNMSQVILPLLLLSPIHHFCVCVCCASFVCVHGHSSRESSSPIRASVTQRGTLQRRPTRSLNPQYNKVRGQSHDCLPLHPIYNSALDPLHGGTECALRQALPVSVLSTSTFRGHGQTHKPSPFPQEQRAENLHRKAKGYNQTTRELTILSSFSSSRISQVTPPVDSQLGVPAFHTKSITRRTAGTTFIHKA